MTDDLLDRVRRLSLREGQDAARALRQALRGAVSRAVVVGSVRRGLDEVGDVELLVEPARQTGTLFDERGGAYDVEAVQAAFARHVGRGRVTKRGTRMLQGVTADGEKLELWVCRPPATWGTLMAIRTGPADLGKEAVTRIRDRGWRVKGGAVWQPTTEGNPGAVELSGEDGWWAKRPTPTEAEFFGFAGMPLVPAARRDDLARRECRADTWAGGSS